MLNYLHIKGQPTPKLADYTVTTNVDPTEPPIIISMDNTLTKPRSRKLLYCEMSDDVLRKMSNSQPIQSFITDTIFDSDDYKFFYRGDGFVNNMALDQRNNTSVIITNDDNFLDDKSFWNETEKTYDVFFLLNRDTPCKVVKLQDTTDKYIRYAHNIRKLYLHCVIGYEEVTEDNACALYKSLYENHKS